FPVFRVFGKTAQPVRNCLPWPPGRLADFSLDVAGEPLIKGVLLGVCLQILLGACDRQAEAWGQVARKQPIPRRATPALRFCQTCPDLRTSGQNQPPRRAPGVALPESEPDSGYSRDTNQSPDALPRRCAAAISATVAEIAARANPSTASTGLATGLK